MRPVAVKVFWHSTCPVCRQGHLEAVKLRATGVLFLLCDECEWAWQHPDLIDPSTYYDFGSGQIVPATGAEIEGAKWGPLKEKDEPWPSLET